MNPDAFSFENFNWLGFGLAIAANMVLGFIWYAPWTPTGKIWMRNQGLDPTNLPKVQGTKMAVSMILMVIGVTLMMFVFTHTNGVYLDAFRNEATGGDMDNELRLMDGVMGGFFTWLGFVVPIALNTVAFENKPWSTFFVNSGYYLVTLLVAGVLIASVGGF